MEVKKKKIELSYEKIYDPLCSKQHYLQQPRHGRNLNVHQQINRLKNTWCVGVCVCTMEYQSLKRRK